MSGTESVFGFLKNYDFLNLGWQPELLAALYGAVILLVLLVVVLIVAKCIKSGRKTAAAEEAEEIGGINIGEINKEALSQDVFGSEISKTESKIENKTESKKEKKDRIRQEKREKKQPKFNGRLLASWQEKMPAASALWKYWQLMSDEEKETVGNLSRENNWAEAYLAKCGSDEAAFAMFLELWRYQGEKSDNLLKMLMRELANLHIEQSMAACRLIAEIKDERIVPLLLFALLKPEKYPPARVAEALAAFGVVAARALAALYRRVEAADCKLLILDAMGQLQKLCPLSVLKEAVNCDNDEIRKKAAEIIGIVRPENALELLRPMVVDGDGKIRSAAAAALGQIGGEKCYVILKDIQEKDPDWQVKSTCQAFISRWENAIQDRVAFDEVDRWLAENTHPAAADETPERNIG